MLGEGKEIADVCRELQIVEQGLPTTPVPTGWIVKHKKLQRIWCEEGLQVPIRARRKRLGSSTARETPIADAPTRVWAV
jgi:hypothetical protein